MRSRRSKYDGHAVVKTFHQHDYRSEPSATDNAEVTDVTTVSRRGFKNHTNLDQRGRKSKKIGGWKGLGRSWCGSWDLWCALVGTSREVGAKMGAR